MWYRHALEYLHIALVIFIFAGFIVQSPAWKIFWFHRAFVPFEFILHRINGTCPLTDLTKYLHKLEDPSFVPPEMGCIQQLAYNLFGIHLPEIVITLIALFLSLVCLWDFWKVYKGKKSTERTSPP